MIRGITFDKQLLKSGDHAHEVNHYYAGNMGVSKGCEVIENVDGNLVVDAGYFIIKGRLVSVDGSETITVPIVPSGTLYSILVFEIDLTQVNTTTVFNQGTFKILSDALDYPTLTQEDLDNGGTLYQFEFVRFENTVGGIVVLTDTSTVLDMVQYAKTDTLTATLPYTSWTGSSAPFSKAITVTGILSTDYPNFDVELSGTYATDITRKDEWAKVYGWVTSTNTITFYATEVPSVDLPLIIKVVR